MTLPSRDQLEAIERAPEVLSGAWRFGGTRIPVATLFANLRDGATVADVLSWLPGITDDQVRQVLDFDDQAWSAPSLPPKEAKQ